MKATLLLTTSCNLRCDYCYINRKNHTMSDATMAKAIDFAFRQAEMDGRLDIGLFGGEPLTNPTLMKKTVALIERRTETTTIDVRVSLVTNGTLLCTDIIDYLRNHRVIVQVSCDGIPRVHDRHRFFPGGKGSSSVVEENLKASIARLPSVLVNIVYRPDTYSFLPESISYLTSLGLRQLILNPDYSAAWSEQNIAGLRKEYMTIADLYLDYYRIGSPLFLSLIDEKIAITLRGGYEPSERCHMGHREFAFSPKGFIYPCERLVGDGNNNHHSIGHLDQPDPLNRNHCDPAGNRCERSECETCGVANFCMNWCACTNYFSTGSYNQPSHFICSSERFAIEAAQKVLACVDDSEELMFLHHYAGLPMVNSSRPLNN